MASEDSTMNKQGFTVPHSHVQPLLASENNNFTVYTKTLGFMKR